MRAGLRRVLATLAGLLLALGFVLGVATPAHAAGDTYDRFDVDYTVTADGLLRVTETIELRFGPNSGRHGYERYLVTREPFDDDQDMSYEVTNIQVASLCMKPNQVRLIPNASFQPNWFAADADGNEFAISSGISWASSNAGVVAVNGSGVFSSTGNLGEATVSAAWRSIQSDFPST